MKEIFCYLKPYRKGLLAAALAMAVSTVCNLLLPTIMSDILNNGVYRGDYPYIVHCCVIMLVVALLGLGSVLLGSWLSCNVVASFCADLRGTVFRKVNAMSFEEFGSLGTAALATRCSHDVDTLSWIAAEMTGPMVTIPVMFLGGTVLALQKDVMLSAVMLAFIPVILAMVLILGKKIRPLWDKTDEYFDKVNELTRQRIRGIRVIRAFNAEGAEHRKMAETIGTMSDMIVKSNVTMDAVVPITTFLLNAAAVLIVYLGGWELERKSGLTGGDIFAIVQYTALVANSVIMGSFAIVMFPHVRVAADRIGQVLHSRGMDDPEPPKGQKLSGRITFDHVSFRYSGAEEPALRNISFSVAPGETVAVIGGTGAGKSTLVSLLLGFRMPTEGAVRLDGIPTEKLSRRDLRDNISCALQNGAVYSGTLRENIRMGRLDAGDSQILEALETAQAMEFVRRFPEGLDHVIRQSGKNLSGGQKQRLSIARAILKEAPVYIFDDSFSALDFLTEQALRFALNRRLAGKTQIIITQRVTSAMHCDRVLVMDGGELVDMGTHAELLDRCQVYRDIFASQTGGGSLGAEEA